MIEIVRDFLWTDYQPMNFMLVPIGRRCAVVRSGSGALIVFSPLEATQENVARLKSIGEVSAFVLPSRLHDRFYDGYFTSFRDAQFLAPPAVIKDHRAWPLKVLSPDNPLLAGIRTLELKGMPGLQENVFLHEASRTLLVADALFNIPKAHGLRRRLLLRGAGIGATPGVCRLFRLLVRDRSALAASVKEMLAWDFNRIVPGHGEIVERGAKEVMRHAFRKYAVG